MKQQRKLGLCNKIKLWFKSFGNWSNMPDIDTPDYVNLNEVDLSSTELMFISSERFVII